MFGVSADTPAKQQRFREKYALPFHLLADADKTVCKAYDVLKEKNMYGRKTIGIARTTYVIGANGKIARVFENVKPEGHAEEVLAAVR